MCGGHHRREVAKLQRLRLVLAEVRNGLRGPEQEAQRPADILPLPGDELASTSAQLTPEEIEAEFARVSLLDADLL